MRIVGPAPLLRPLEPAPLGAWYAERKDWPGQVGKEQWDYRKSGLPAYVPEIDVNRGDPIFRGQPVDNGGTAALEAFVDEAGGRTPGRSIPRDDEAWLAHDDEVFRRGAAHLRNLGLAHHVWQDNNLLVFLPEGTHPFVAAVKDLFDLGIRVTFSPEHTDDMGACVIRGRAGMPELRIGAALLLELDPNAEWLRHERAHIEHDLNGRATPYTASLRARGKNDRLPGPVDWGYRRYESMEEMLAYTEGISGAFMLLLADALKGKADQEKSISYLFDSLMLGVQASLRGIASSKQALAAIDERTFQLLPKPVEAPHGKDTFRISRRGGDGYHITVKRDLGLILGAIDNALARPGETGWLTRRRLRSHFGWQLRAAREHLAVLRVAAQALEAFEATNDPRYCNAAMSVFGLQRARTDKGAEPVGYGEALAHFNATLAEELPFVAHS